MIRSRILHHAIRAVILAGFSCYILVLVRTNAMHYYISPRMEFYVKLSAIGLYAVAVYQAYLAVVTAWTRRTPECECEGEPLPPFRWKTVAIYTLFAFPLLLGFLLPDALLGSSMAAKRGMTLSGADAVKNAETIRSSSRTPAAAAGDGSAAPNAAAMPSSELDALFPSDKFSEPYARLAMELYGRQLITVQEDWFMETITSVDLYLDRFIGKKIEFFGFVYREDDMRDSNSRFVVARFVQQCCTADASPVGILVDADRAQAYAGDTWVRITGTIGKSDYHGLDLLTVKAERIERIAAPQNSYVYPNPDFGT